MDPVMYYSPFPAVADAVQSELEQYKQLKNISEVKWLKDTMISVHVLCYVSIHIYVHKHCDRWNYNIIQKPVVTNYLLK